MVSLRCRPGTPEASDRAASPGATGAYAAPGPAPGDRPVALVFVARVDAEARRTLALAGGLAPTVLAVHVCDPAQPTASATFLREWDSAGLDVALVLVAAAPGRLGVEAAGFVARRFPSRRVHALIGTASGTAVGERPAAQLERSLSVCPGVVLHRVVGRSTPGSGPDGTDPGPLFAIAVGSVAAVVVLAELLRLPGAVAGPAAGLVAVWCVRGLTLPWRAAVALAAWAVVTGFVVNDGGVLTLGGADLRRMAGFVLGAAAVPPVLRRLRRLRGAVRR